MMNYNEIEIRKKWISPQTIKIRDQKIRQKQTINLLVIFNVVLITIIKCYFSCHFIVSCY